MRLSRLAALAAAPLALAALVSLTAPASAGVQFNALVENALIRQRPSHHRLAPC